MYEKILSYTYTHRPIDSLVDVSTLVISIEITESTTALGHKLVYTELNHWSNKPGQLK